MADKNALLNVLHMLESLGAIMDGTMPHADINCVSCQEPIATLYSLTIREGYLQFSMDEFTAMMEAIGAHYVVCVMSRKEGNETNAESGTPHETNG